MFIICNDLNFTKIATTHEPMTDTTETTTKTSKFYLTNMKLPKSFGLY